MYPDAKEEIVQLYLEDIIPNRYQPRVVFDEKALKELAVSIKEHGVIEPIIVRPVKNGKYEIIAGERRCKAAALAGKTKIPAIIRDLDDKESSKVALIENLQRKNLNPIEEARTYQKILEIDQMTQEELAKTMGKSQSAVANKIRLLTLPEEIQDALLKEKISERHARSLLTVPNIQEQKDLLKKVIDNKMSVKSLEEEIKNKYPKVEVEKEQQEKSNEKEEQIVSSDTFVNNNPLIPTAKLPEDTSNYGKVTIAPPEGDEKEMGKFINYGDLDNNDTQGSDEGTGSIFDMPPAVTSLNIKNPSSDDNSSSKGGAALDNLLNLGNPTSSIPSNDFITPAEKIVKTDPGEEIVDVSSDYFKLPDIENIEKASNIINPMDNNMFLSSPTINTEEDKTKTTEEEREEIFTIETASRKIAELIEEIKKHGIDISSNVMDFEKSIQIIIKIEKN